EPSRLREDVARDPDLADVVEQRAELEPLQAALVEGELVADAPGGGGAPACVPFCPVSGRPAPVSSRFRPRLSKSSSSPTRKARSVIQRACMEVYSSLASSAFASASTVETNVCSRPS